MAALRAAVFALVNDEVLVGFPADTTDRTDEDTGLPLSTGSITNAALGYIHDTGMPEQNIPARPFMLPGMRNAEDNVARILVQAAKSVLTERQPRKVTQYLHRAGLAAQVAIRRKINEGIPPPLAESTLRERARRGRKGAKKELVQRAEGIAASTEFAKPLIDTGQLRNAVNYVIRKRKLRRK
mgnify:CR=1 FL=1